MARQVAGAGFDLELKYGKEREQQLGRLAEHTRIEVKSDRYAASTGNLAVEYQQRLNGRWRQSGIATTEADMYVFELVGLETWIWVETARLKALTRRAIGAGLKKDVGDGGNHRNAMVPIEWITRTWREA